MKNCIEQNKEIISTLIDSVTQRDAISPELYTKYNVKRGLRNSDGTGVLVGLTAIGEVHGYMIEDSDKIPSDGKLLYRGIQLKEILKGAMAENRYAFEEVCFLILFGKLPSSDELQAFSELLVSLRKLPPNFVEDMIIKAPSPDIMNKLARNILSLYSYDSNPDSTEISNVIMQSISLISKFPILIANSYSAKRHVYNDESLIIHTPSDKLSTAENFLYMLRPAHEYTKEEVETLDLCLAIHAEHGGGNNSAFTTHVVSSSGTDTYAAISSAVNSLKGPKHGGASTTVSLMFNEIKENVKDWSNEQEIKNYLTKIVRGEAFDRSGLIYGMGHAIYTKSDPRAVLLKSKASKLAQLKGREKEFMLYDTVERLSPIVFAEVKHSDKMICANVDFYSGFVYSMLGIKEELYTPLFAMSRVVGWCAHRIEEIVSGGRIIRPAYKSVTTKSTYVPLDKRK